MVEHVRALVIGGGAVGCSCLYHLAALGWTDIVLLEQHELTSGSTWHAAGNCPTFATSWSLLKLQQYSAGLYRQLAADPTYPINYHVTGSVRLAHTEERMDEYRYVAGLARGMGLNYELLSPPELRERYPFVELDDLRGALWDPQDGDIDPAQLTQAMASAARNRGARIHRGTNVTALRQRGDSTWHVTTSNGEFIADVVVNAAGYRAGEVMRLLGRSLSIVTMSHQYLVTEDIDALSKRDTRLPLLRDPDASYYLRQERDGLILGPYEQQATPAWLDGIPEDFSFQLWEQDLRRLEPQIEAACARVPLLATAGIKKVINGPIPYSPDGLPYVGPAHGLRNFFHCNTFSFGITQAGGAGKALAEWVVHGVPEWDLWNLDSRRFGAFAIGAYATAKAIETYQYEYAPAFPLEERCGGRPLRISPLHGRLAARGAIFGARAGWEKALWYDIAGAARRHPTFRRQHSWTDAVREEVHAVRNGAGIADLPGFTKFMIEGPGASGFLDRLVCSRLPHLGRVRLAYVLNAQGHIVSEFTLARLGADRFYAVSSSAAELHDDDVLMHSLPADGSATVTRLTERWGTLILAGPRARDILSGVTQAGLANDEFPWLAARWIDVGGAQVLALRINYVGELGWELHGAVASMAGAYDSLIQAGAKSDLRHFGLYAMDSLRMDKAYRGWKTELDSTRSMHAAGLERFLIPSKMDAVGTPAQRRALFNPARKLAALRLDTPGIAEALAGSTVTVAGHIVGMVTSSAWSFTLDCSVSLAYLRTDVLAPGTQVEIDVLGERVRATVQVRPLYDPESLRPRT